VAPASSAPASRAEASAAASRFEAASPEAGDASTGPPPSARDDEAPVEAPLVPVDWPIDDAPEVLPLVDDVPAPRAASP
jgi:hypothetical protein